MITGLELDDYGMVGVLDASTWKDRQLRREVVGPRADVALADLTAAGDMERKMRDLIDAVKQGRADRGRLLDLEALVRCSSRTLSPDAEREWVVWRFTLEKPAEGWASPDFDDHTWQRGTALFGTKDIASRRTLGSSRDIWLRREFELPDVPDGAVACRAKHDDAIEVYLNGVLIAQQNQYSAHYWFEPCRGAVNI
jgi:hypothetical protein